MKHYSYQKFIHDLDTDSVNINDHMSKNPFCYDEQHPIDLYLSVLDLKIDTLDEFNKLIDNLDSSKIVLIDNRPHTENAIIKDFEEYTLKGYIKYLSYQGLECFVRSDL